jgi:hypothetical protein
MEIVMKKLILAAAMFAPLAIAAPALAQDASGASNYIETPAVTTYAPNQPREFIAAPAKGIPASHSDQGAIARESVPSSAFGGAN